MGGGRGEGDSLYTNKNCKNKLKIYIVNFLIKMKLFSQKSRQNPSQKYLVMKGLIFSEHVNHLEN